MVHNFEKIGGKMSFDTFCIVCGKQRKRTHEVYETLNPWNKNDDGALKTREQICESVKEKIKKVRHTFLTEGIICRTCENKMSYKERKESRENFKPLDISHSGKL